MGAGRRAVLGAVALLLLLPACHGKGEDSGDTGPLPACEAPEPPPEATLMLWEDPALVLLPNGRALTPEGVQVPVDNQLGPLVLSADGSRAYVLGINRYRRSLHVVDVDAGAVLQDLELDDAWYGLVLSADGSTLYASGGSAGTVGVFELDEDGLVAGETRFETGGYPAGLALSADGSTLYVADYSGRQLLALDAASGELVGSYDCGLQPFSLVRVPGREELWVSDLGGEEVAVVDPSAGGLVATLEAPSDPEGLVASPDGGRVYAARSSTDSVVAWDVDSLSVVAEMELTGDLLGPTGEPLPAVGPTALALDAERGLLYATRSSDNAVGVLDAESLAPLGAFPVGWYPVSLAVAPGGRVVVANMKGSGAGPNLEGEAPPCTISGSLSIVEPDGLDLDAATAQVESNLRRPDEVYPFDCEGRFPVPTDWGTPSRDIHHVILVVRENKTFDVELGDLEGAEGDPDAAYLAPYVPNLHALAERFTVLDNFYTDSEVSTQGHLWLTGLWVDDFMEKSWMEAYHGGGDFAVDAVSPAATPGFGTFFTHLLEQGVDFSILGEIVGIFDGVDGEYVMEHLEAGYPGAFFDLSVQDTERAAWAADHLFGEDGQGGDFPPFVFMLLPDDHTGGPASPEAMIADNDAATGLLVERLSHSVYWEDTVLFVVEDDPQQGTDHVDTHRSYCLVVSPWARHGHVSHVLGSFPSVFRTIELVLGIPPMNRFDALATPLWDAFTAEPDPEPYEALPAAVPWEQPWRPLPPPLEELRERMDFRGPDRVPYLGDWLWWYFHGFPRPGSLLERYAAGERDVLEWLREEDDEDEEVFALHYALLAAWKREHPDSPLPDPPRGWEELLEDDGDD